MRAARPASDGVAASEELLYFHVFPTIRLDHRPLGTRTFIWRKMERKKGTHLVFPSLSRIVTRNEFL